MNKGANNAKSKCHQNETPLARDGSI